MRILNRDASKTIFIDVHIHYNIKCNIATGVLQPLNFAHISRYTGYPLDI